MRIYIVEDDADIRGMMTYALRNSGYEVEGFGDGKSFFEAVGARTPDLVLSTFCSPGRTACPCSAPCAPGRRQRICRS